MGFVQSEQSLYSPVFKSHVCWYDVFLFFREIENLQQQKNGMLTKWNRNLQNNIVHMFCPLCLRSDCWNTKQHADDRMNVVEMHYQSTKRIPQHKAIPLPIRWLFCEFTKCINIKLNASIFHLRLLAILIKLWSSFRRFGSVFLQNENGLCSLFCRSSFCRHPTLYKYTVVNELAFSFH